MVQLWCWKGAGVGVIDAIADGCFAVARRPAVVVPVVALDLLYWLGGRLTPAPFTDGLVRLIELGQQQNPAASDPSDTIDALRTVGQTENLLSLLALGQKPLLPQLTGDEVGRPWGTGTIETGHWSIVILLAIILSIVGLFWLALALSVLAPLVRGEPFEPLTVLRRVPRCWLRLLGLVAIIIAGLILLGMPLLILSGLMVIVGLSPGILVLVTFIPLLLLYVHLSLAPEAIVVSDVGPFEAIKLSIRVVRRNFWPMFGLLAATILIEQGFPIGWSLLTRQTAGVPLAIIGNGFVGTGLTAAAMFFYRERLLALETQPTVVGNRQEREQRPGQRPGDRR
jgi:hypothetical protein